LRGEADPLPRIIRTITIASDDTTTSILDSNFAMKVFKYPIYKDEDEEYYRPNPFVWNAVIHNIPFNRFYFNYYGPHMIKIDVTSESMQNYFEEDSLEQKPYKLLNSNIENGYGLFLAPYSRCFFAPDTT